jgi:hypothetical protein
MNAGREIYVIPSTPAGVSCATSDVAVAREEGALGSKHRKLQLYGCGTWFLFANAFQLRGECLPLRDWKMREDYLIGSFIICTFLP